MTDTFQARIPTLSDEELRAGVHGESLDGIGVLGEGKEFGVRGFSATGEGVLGVSVKIGGVGVHGIANISGNGVPALKARHAYEPAEPLALDGGT